MSVDIRMLPSLVPPDLVNLTAHAVVPVLEGNIAKVKTLLASNDLTSESNTTPPDSTCQFALYAQVHPSNISAVDMRELEDELMHPTGVTTVSRPPLLLDLALVSPECGVLIEAKEADGMRSRMFFRKVTSCSSTPMVLFFCLLILL
jgi:transmembrane E3 ubiquitin-protein ligase